MSTSATANVSTEALIQDLRADLGRTSETIVTMLASLDAIGHRYAELQYQLAQVRALAPAAQAPVMMTELGSALIKAPKTLGHEPAQIHKEGGHSLQEAAAGDHTGAAEDLSVDERQALSGELTSEQAGGFVDYDATASLADGADHTDHDSQAIAPADLDDAFEQVGTTQQHASAPTSVAAPQPAARPSVFSGVRRAGAGQASAALPSAPAPAALTKGVTSRQADATAGAPVHAPAAAPVTPRTFGRGAAAANAAAAPTPTAAPTAVQRQASAATVARLDPMGGTGGASARPRLRTLGGAGR